jgi:hypothetical protein
MDQKRDAKNSPSETEGANGTFVAESETPRLSHLTRTARNRGHFEHLSAKTVTLRCIIGYGSLPKLLMVSVFVTMTNNQ